MPYMTWETWVGVAQNVRKNLEPGGTLMPVEPTAGFEDNLHALGGVFYAASTVMSLLTPVRKTPSGV